MVIVMCVMIVVTALSLALLLTASVLMRNASVSNQKEQCRITAVSVSEVLRKEIESFSYYNQKPSDNPDRETNLKSKLQSVGTIAWVAYRADAEATDRQRNHFVYELEDCGLPGSAKVELYFTDELGVLDGADITNDNFAQDYQELVLYVKVTGTVGKESSTIISCYSPVISGDGWSSWRWEYQRKEWEGSGT